MFKPGQRVVCVNKNTWFYYSDVTNYGPAYLEVVTIIETHNNYLFFAEYPLLLNGKPCGYQSDVFRPLSEVSAELTNQIVEKLEQSIYVLQ